MVIKVQSFLNEYFPLEEISVNGLQRFKIYPSFLVILLILNIFHEIFCYLKMRNGFITMEFLCNIFIAMLGTINSIIFGLNNNLKIALRESFCLKTKVESLHKSIIPASKRTFLIKSFFEDNIELVE